MYGAQLTGPRPDTIAQGPFRRFWRDGSLEELGHFTTGQADSVWTRYYPAKPGQRAAVARRLPMRAGQPDGPFAVFHPDGRVAQRGTFRRGQLVDSLVTTSKTGSPRLLARFDSSRTPGPHGSFRQWGGQYTSNFAAVVNHWGEGTSYNNTYPRYDSARYWLGKLVTGRLVGPYTEYDADGEPRVRLSYTAQGQYRLTTMYYPAAWVRNEQGRDQPLPADSVMHSLPLLEWQAVGPRPRLLLRYWRFNYFSTTDYSEDRVFKLVSLTISWNRRLNNYRIRPRYGYANDVVGSLKGPGRSVPLPPQVAAAFLKPVANQPGPACNNLETQCRTHGRPPLPTLPLTDGTLLRRYPPLSRYRHPLALEAVRHPGRWHLGAADTTGARLRPARRRETIYPDKRRVLETPFATRVYTPQEQLVEVTHWRFLGRRLQRVYYNNGQPASVTRTGLLAAYSRRWDEAGVRSSLNLNRVVGVRMVKVRRQVVRQGKVETILRIRPRFRKPPRNILR